MSKRKKSHNFLVFIVWPLLFALIAFGYWFFVKDQIFGDNADTIDWIASHYTRSGRLMDLQNDLGLDSEDNIKLYVTEKFITISFGKAELKWKPDEFVTKENQELLKKIYITMDNDPKTGKLRVYYKEKELTRWAY